MALEKTFGRDGTSGLMLTEYEDGSLRLEYVDYNVGFFGGADFECWYTLNKENAEKFRAALDEKYPAYKGDPEKQACEAFGENMDERAFGEFCSEYGIAAERGSWSSFNFDDFKDF